MDRAISKVQKLKTRRKLSLPGSSLVFSPTASLVQISSPTNNEVDSESGDDNTSPDSNNVTGTEYFEQNRDEHFHTQRFISFYNKEASNKSKDVG